MKEFANREAANASGEKVGFSFGKNWQKYLNRLTEERISTACASIRTLRDGRRLQGRPFWTRAVAVVCFLWQPID